MVKYRARESGIKSRMHMRTKARQPMVLQRTSAVGAEHLADDIVSMTFAGGRLELRADCDSLLHGWVALTRVRPIMTLRSGVRLECRAVLESGFPSFRLLIRHMICTAKYVARTVLDAENTCKRTQDNSYVEML